MEHSAELRIYLLGTFRVVAGGREIAATAWRRRKAAGVVKLLALAPCHRLHRDQIMDRLWPEMEQAEAANNLHRALYDARRILQPGRSSSSPGCYLLRQGDMVALDPRTPVWTDLDTFRAAAAVALSGRDPTAFHRALALYTGELLPDDCYEDWTISHREDVRAVVTDLLWRLASLSETSGEPEGAIDALRRLVRIEPAHEGARSGLMRLYAASGDRQQAIRQYHQLRAALRRDLDADPDPAVEQLYRAILAGRFAAGRRSDAAVFSDGAQPVQHPRMPPNNLPHQLTTFVGREQELAEVRQLLGLTRILTLTGAGGCGKTRLALEAATGLGSAFPDGVWFVELAALADPHLVPHAVASMFGLHETVNNPLLTLLCNELRSKHALLVLDNCEHVIDACAQLAATILQACPGVRILATSREGLNINGEVSWLVPSLPCPDPRNLPELDRLTDYDAVHLFVDRARMNLPRFRLTPENAPAIVQVCQRLDGIPLALELAASRVSVLSVEQIVARLGDCLELLVHGTRATLPRHQTLRSTIDWSYALLTETERALFRRLAVFAGGFSLGAAETVVGHEGTDAERPGSGALPPASVLDLLTSLVDKSLLGVQESGGEHRYRFLEPVRQYAERQLRESGEEERIRARHCAWCLALGEQGESTLTSPDQGDWLDRLETEHDNLRAALRWALEQGDAERGLRLAASLWRFWHVRGHLSEGRRWLETFLQLEFSAAANGDHASVLTARATALMGAGVLAITQGDQEQAHALLAESRDRFQDLGNQSAIAASLHQLATVAQNQGDRAGATALAEESLAMWRQIGNTQGVANALHRLGSVARELGHYARAATLIEESIDLYRRLGDREGAANALNTLGKVVRDQGHAARAIILHEESLRLHRSLDDPWGISRALALLGMAVWFEGNDERAAALFEESLALDRRLGDRWGIAGGQFDLGMLKHYRGDQAASRELLEESLRLCRESGNIWNIARALHGLGLVARIEGDWPSAAERFREGLRLADQTGMPGQIAGYLEGLAGVAIDEGRPERAATLFAAAAARRAALGTPIPPLERAAYERDILAIRRAMPDDVFRVAWEAGQTLTVEQAVEEALCVQVRPAISTGIPGSMEPARRAARLSPREREIALLIAQGLTNRQIAAELGTSSRTTDTHVSRLLRKLGVTSRTQVALAIDAPLPQ